MKRSFFQAAIVSVLLFGCTRWTLTKRMEKKLDSNYTKMLRVILNKSWRQHCTNQQLYGQLPLITKTIKIRHAGHCWRSRDKLICDVSFGPLHMDEQRQDVQLEITCSSSVPIWDVALRTFRKQWTIGRCDERRPEITLLIARHDDDDVLFRKSTNFLNIPSVGYYIMRGSWVVGRRLFGLVKYWVLWDDLIVFGIWLLGFSYYPTCSIIIVQSGK